jgi:hypothetical protein
MVDLAAATPFGEGTAKSQTRGRGMSKVKLFGVSVIAAFALGAVAAVEAWASSGLELKTNGQDLPVGSRVGVEIEWRLGGCWTNESGWGTLSVNGAAEDKIAHVKESEEGSLCSWSENGKQDYMTGEVHGVDLTSSGQATVKEAVRLYIYEDEGERLCAYTFKTLHGTFQTSGVVELFGTAVGKLYMPGSSPSGCAKKVTTEWWWLSIDGEPEPGRFWLTESELVG